MSLIPGASSFREDAVQLAAYLVERKGLSLDHLKQIIALQRAQELRFSEAALHLGLALPADLDAARHQRSDAPAPVIGQAAAELHSYRDLGHPETQKIGSLRAQLLLRQPAGQGIKLAVVSASVGDGRSRLAAALAMSCAQSGQATLLIDADLRNPAQQQLFNLHGGVGLLQALQGAALPQPATIDGMPQLAVLAAGGQATDALELVSSQPFRELIESYAGRYRHIIIDTPATGIGFDGTATAMACGAALLLCRRHHTPLDACQQLVSQLRSTPARLLGSVLRG